MCVVQGQMEDRQAASLEDQAKREGGGGALRDLAAETSCMVAKDGDQNRKSVTHICCLGLAQQGMQPHG